jgi:hypothetical protein
VSRSSTVLVNYVTGDTKVVIRICISKLASMSSAVLVNYVTGDTKGVTVDDLDTSFDLKILIFKLFLLIYLTIL